MKEPKGESMNAGRSVSGATSRVPVSLVLMRFVLGWVLFLPWTTTATADPLIRAQAIQTLTFVEQQLLDSITEVPSATQYPRSTHPTTGVWTTVSASDWTSGFFPGLLWRMHGYSGNATLLSEAIARTAGIASQATRTDTHDLGFMVGIPFRLGYEETSDPTYLSTYLTAAASLASRYDADVDAIRSWDWGSWQFPVIIDNMMNLELLYQGALWTSVPADAATWTSRASDHAATTTQHHIRGDGSTYHWVDFDPSTGAVVDKGTHQGYNTESTWARGQAWALHGYTTTYRMTGDAARLQDAETVADYFIDNLPTGDVPHWDFEAPGIPSEPHESSAAAVAAAGLLELSTQVTDPADQARYFDAAEAILVSLMSPAYLVSGSESSGILLHGLRAQPWATEVDVSLVYGDYYFVDALIRYVESTGAGAPASSPPSTTLTIGLISAAGAWTLIHRMQRRAS